MSADKPSVGRPAEPAVAYVFWHPPAAGQPVDSYEQALCDFHRSLIDVRVDGLTASRVARVSGLPWLSDGGYEDWYIVRGFSDLETLNSAPVDAARDVAHGEIAARSGQGAGAVYGLVIGTATQTPTWTTWLSKPRGTAYEDFYTGLLSRVEKADRSLLESIGIWRRQLVLGPAPEFCVTSTGPMPGLPSEWSAVTAEVDRVYAS